MHISNFILIEEGSNEVVRELALSVEVSEWLFSNHFWKEINDKYGTLFDQYEEECISAPLSIAIADLLKLQVNLLNLLPKNIIRFRYGWNEKKEELFYSVARDKVIDELVQLTEFFKNAETSEMVIHCQL